MTKLLEIEAAAEALPPEQKLELFHFLAAHLRSALAQPQKARLVRMGGVTSYWKRRGCSTDDPGKRQAHVGRLAVSWLLDVNLILASRWTTHSDHLPAKAWIAATDNEQRTTNH